MKALCFSRFGGSDVLEYREVPAPDCKEGDALVRTRAIGLNFADIYRRRGNYHLDGSPPYILGYEAAGEVVAVRARPSDAPVQVGARVGFADVPFANAELVCARLDRLIPLPEEVSFELAAASLLQGLTAQYLTEDSHPVHEGETVLVHAAAGGVGSLLVQIARMRGARVLGLTSTTAKAERALALGAEVVASYGSGWVVAARKWSGGRGVDVVYDSVGTTLPESLQAARTGGSVVFYGMAGGSPPPIDARLLMDESKTVTGGDLWNVLTSYEQRIRRAGILFGWMRAGLRVEIAKTFSLEEGARAHDYLESRASMGKVLLVP